MHIKPSLLLVLAITCSCSSKLSFEQADALSDRDEAALTSDQHDLYVASQGRAGGEAIATCRAADPRASLSDFALIMKLDASGKITQTWLQGDSDLAKCFQKEMSQKSFFTPPRAPFYSGFGMKWDH